MTTPNPVQQTLAVMDDLGVKLTEQSSVPNRASLYEMESNITALLDTEDMVPPELREQFVKELQQSIRTTVAKRDSVARAITWLMSQADLAKQERDRLKARELYFRTAAANLSEYVLGVIRAKGLDDKGKWPKLEGGVSTLAPVRCPPSVDTKDELVPWQYQNITVKIKGADWLALAFDKCEPCKGTGHIASIVEDVHTEEGRKGVQCQVCGGAGRTKSFLHDEVSHIVSMEPSKSTIKPLLEAGEQIPGAKLVTDKLRLEVR